MASISISTIEDKILVAAVKYQRAKDAALEAHKEYHDLLVLIRSKQKKMQVSDLADEKLPKTKKHKRRKKTTKKASAIQVVSLRSTPFETYNYVKEYPKLTLIELADKMGVTKHTLDQRLLRLRKAGVVGTEPKGSSGRDLYTMTYVVKDNVKVSNGVH
jgi:predicted transcriptional regulator